MFKKGSPAQGNTLFKYFAKSPATPKQSSAEAGSSTKLEFGTPKNSIVKTEKRSKIDETPRENSDDEDQIIQKKKRRRIILTESDDDEENENSNDHDNASGTESPTRIKHKLKLEDTPKSIKKIKVEKENTPSQTTTFEAKLKTVKSEKLDTELPDEDVNVIIDEPTIWPHMKLDFLKPENIKDKKGHRPDHPDYNPRTLYVPESYLNKLTPGVRQWWVLKSNHYDCVLFFKVGKFYELYHWDAEVGVKELGFTYMKGDFAHSGFPESAYERMSTTLVERGYKVARVEQTETPDMMSERCKTMKNCTKFDRVVNREICQVTNKGTQVFGQQVQITVKHQPNYLLSIVETHTNNKSRYGICFIDTSIGDFNLGEFDDDTQCSRLLTFLAHNTPVLFLHERNGNSPRTMQIFKTMLGNSIREPLATESELWAAGKTLKFLAENYYSTRKEGWPKVLKLMQDDSDHLGLSPVEHFTLALRALGGCIWYLQKSFLDQQVLAMARYHLYNPPDVIDVETYESKNNKLMNKHMVIDSITISNLKIIGEEFSLQSTLDYCCTKFGKRLLHYWICSPSCDIDEIRNRQEAVTELYENNELLQEIRALLGTLPDLERLVAQTHTFGNKSRLKNHPDGRAIFFEEKTYSKKKINDFIATLNGFKSCSQIPKIFINSNSGFLNRITQLPNTGIFPDVVNVLKFFETAFDHEEAKKEGVIAPGKGVDSEFDAVEEEIEEIHMELKEYLKEQEKFFGCRLNYFGNDKKRFQIEVPDSHAKKANSRYSLESQKKGSKRYYTDESKEYLKRMLSAEERRNLVLKDLARRIFEKFSNHFELWRQCYELVATLDVIASLAEYARNQGNSCLPEIVDPVNGKPVFEIEEGFHPCMTASDFIPNGILLGDKSAPLALLTGPNMGGKSTLMRQVGLIAIMVQIGSRIPADRCRMSLVDRIFTRLGAQDDIMAGHSTFLVELNETSAILKHATRNSLVLLDELGRGTATYDGTAIAAAVVDFLADLKCRCLFSTHYHSLVDNFHEDKRISLGHMACMVENEDDEDPTQETVTFLYKYSSGPCPKSYGFNAAKLAGMPNQIIRRAHDFSKKVESIALKRKLFSCILLNTDVTQLKDLVYKLKACTVK